MKNRASSLQNNNPNISLVEEEGILPTINSSEVAPQEHAELLHDLARANSNNGAISEVTDNLIVFSANTTKVPPHIIDSTGDRVIPFLANLNDEADEVMELVPQWDDITGKGTAVDLFNDNNGIGDGLVIQANPAIQDALFHIQSNDCQVLDLSRGGYDSDQLTQIISNIEKNTSLLSLNLSDNNLRLTSFSMFTSTGQLVNIDFSHNPFITNSFMAFLVRCGNKSIFKSPLVFCMVEEVNCLPEKEQEAIQLMMSLNNIIRPSSVSSSSSSSSSSPTLDINDYSIFIQFARNLNIRSIVKYFSEYNANYSNIFCEISQFVNDNLLMLKGVCKQINTGSMLITLPEDALHNIMSFLSFEDIIWGDSKIDNNHITTPTIITSSDLIGIDSKAESE